MSGGVSDQGHSVGPDVGEFPNILPPCHHLAQGWCDRGRGRSYTTGKHTRQTVRGFRRSRATEHQRVSRWVEGKVRRTADY